MNVTDGRTGGQTDGRLTIAIPRFALLASRGKNRCRDGMQRVLRNKKELDAKVNSRSLLHRGRP